MTLWASITGTCWLPEKWRFSEAQNNIKHKGIKTGIRVCHFGTISVCYMPFWH